MDPLLPGAEPGKKKVPDTDYDVTQRYRSERHRSHVCLGLSVSLISAAFDVLQPYNNTSFFQEWYEERHREPRLTLRPPSLAAPYAPVQNWHHQPEKLIFESCAYEANVSSRLPPSCVMRFSLNICTNVSPFPLQYLGSMLIKDLRGTESTQDACAKMRVRQKFLLQPKGTDTGHNT